MSDRLEPIEHNGVKRVPTIAVCRIEECKFEWPIAYTPMPLTQWCEAAKRATCPMCGDKKPLVRQNQGESFTMEITA
jgi:hypothetical protein